MVKETAIEDVFIPEEFDEEQKMIGQTCTDFLDTEVFPLLDKIELLEEENRKLQALLIKERKEKEKELKEAFHEATQRLKA